MLWSQVAPVLLDVIESLALETADPKWKAQWAKRNRSFTSPTVKAAVLLTLTSSREIMTEVRPRFDVPSSSVKEDIHGLREFTLNVQCKSYSQEYASWAHEYAERIRTRMKRKAVRNALLAVNTTYLEAGPIAELDGVEDGRELNLANLDLFFRSGFVDVPPTGGQWIEKLELTSHLVGLDGIELPHPPNLTEALLPPP